MGRKAGIGEEVRRGEAGWGDAKGEAKAGSRERCDAKHDQECAVR